MLALALGGGETALVVGGEGGRGGGRRGESCLGLLGHGRCHQNVHAALRFGLFLDDVLNQNDFLHLDRLVLRFFEAAPDQQRRRGKRFRATDGGLVFARGVRSVR